MFNIKLFRIASAVLLAQCAPAHAQFSGLPSVAPFSNGSIGQTNPPPPDTSMCKLLPPAAMTYNNVWYVDATLGHNQTYWNANPPGTGKAGDASHPWDVQGLQAIFDVDAGVDGSFRLPTGGLNITANYPQTLLFGAPGAGTTTQSPINPGDEVIIRAGNYGSIFVGRTSGTVGGNSWLTIQANPGDSVTITSIWMQNSKMINFTGDLTKNLHLYGTSGTFGNANVAYTEFPGTPSTVFYTAPDTGNVEGKISDIALQNATMSSLPTDTNPTWAFAITGNTGGQIQVTNAGGGTTASLLYVGTPFKDSAGTTFTIASQVSPVPNTGGTGTYTVVSGTPALGTATSDWVQGDYTGIFAAGGYFDNSAKVPYASQCHNINNVHSYYIDSPYQFVTGHLRFTNNEIDHFDDDGIDIDYSSHSFLHNYIHDRLFSDPLNHADFTQFQNPFRSNSAAQDILYAYNKLIYNVDPNLPFYEVSPFTFNADSIVQSQVVVSGTSGTTNNPTVTLSSIGTALLYPGQAMFDVTSGGCAYVYTIQSGPQSWTQSAPYTYTLLFQNTTEPFPCGGINPFVPPPMYGTAGTPWSGAAMVVSSTAPPAQLFTNQDFWNSSAENSHWEITTDYADVGLFAPIATGTYNNDLIGGGFLGIYAVRPIGGTAAQFPPNFCNPGPCTPYNPAGALNLNGGMTMTDGNWTNVWSHDNIVSVPGNASIELNSTCVDCAITNNTSPQGGIGAFEGFPHSNVIVRDNLSLKASTCGETQNFGINADHNVMTYAPVGGNGNLIINGSCTSIFGPNLTYPTNNYIDSDSTGASEFTNYNPVTHNYDVTLRPDGTAPACNAGVPQFPFSPTDFAGNPRTGISFPSAGAYQFQGTCVNTPPPVAQTFTPLHTYYLAPTTATPAGNDSNNGTSAATPWATPNHAVVCGDAIIAAAGTYTSGFNTWGTVSNCPSTTKGIDGSGGVYFATLLCGGIDLEACQMSINTGSDAFGVNKDNWAVEGWKTTAGTGNAYIMEAASSGTVQVHHVAFLNDICDNSQQGFQGDDGGLNHNVPGNGVDYYAFLGDIAQNCAQSGFGVAGINVVLPSPFDSVAGTHIIVNGNYSYTNFTTTACCDGEDYMLDSLDWHGYANQIVVSDNLGFNATRAGFQFTYGGCNVTDIPTAKVYNNTIYGSNQNFTSTDFFNSEFNYGYNPTDCSGATTSTWNVSMTNNLGQTNKASQNGEPIYGLTIDAVQWLTLVDSGNYFNGSATIAHGTPWPASPPYSATYANSNNPSMTDFYTSPNFTNVSDLMTNQTGVPNCTGFQTTVQCMGYNPLTGAMTTPSIISDLVPTANGTAGKGYQLPKVACATNPDYPTWLKGIVYLHWNGTTITENAGLVSKPCGL